MQFSSISAGIVGTEISRKSRCSANIDSALETLIRENNRRLATGASRTRLINKDGRREGCLELCGGIELASTSSSQGLRNNRKMLEERRYNPAAALPCRGCGGGSFSRFFRCWRRSLTRPARKFTGGWNAHPTRARTLELSFFRRAAAAGSYRTFKIRAIKLLQHRQRQRRW